MRKILFLSFVLIGVIFSCKKKEYEPTVKFNLTVTQQGVSAFVLNWTSSNLSGFKSVSIYRSGSPIPAPTLEMPIDPTLLITTISDETIITYKDTILNATAITGALYYMAVINLNNRIIVSNQAQANINAFTLTLPNPSGNNVFFDQVAILPEADILFAIGDGEVLCAVDYKNKKLLATTTLSDGNVFYPVLNAGKTELYVATEFNTIICFDARTLIQKYTINTPYTIRDLCVKNNYIYALTDFSPYYLLTYDCNTQALKEQKYLYNFTSVNISQINIFAGSPTGPLYVKYNYDYYSSSLSQYYYKNVFMQFNLNGNNLPTDSAYINIPALNRDSANGSNQSNYSYMALSTNGSYLACNMEGDIYSLSGNAIRNVATSDNSNPVVSFSHDGGYLLTNPSNTGFSSNLHLFSLPGFNTLSSFTNPNLSFTSTGNSEVSSNFMDNDTLVSYNIVETFTGTQDVYNLTVLYQKVN